MNARSEDGRSALHHAVRPLPLSCVSTAFVAETLPFLADLQAMLPGHEAAVTALLAADGAQVGRWPRHATC